MWREFSIMGFKIFAKVYENPSKYGIAAAPRISKLAIYKGKEWVFNYERGYDFNRLPEWTLRQILNILDHII